MDIIDDYVDEEAYFDIYLSEGELGRLKDGDFIIRQCKINGIVFNFGIYKTRKEKKDEKKTEEEEQG